ncbi:Uu.00g006520.m01.CDS01 [Anthostomella pinea]|uniref:Uu.00g006520.m01.CDS01 n=1 Tax=Anthostomella pinea TaxID=933095 RepID=A0AAI8VL13_9PEZI|nr:Uu.00g006520.m01.CDS01 [Anthostomella pinea]
MVDNRKYFILITKDDSRYRTFQVHKTKNEAEGAIITQLTRVQMALKSQPPDQDGIARRVRILRLDGGREFGTTKMESFCSREAITLILSTPANQYQNGAAERGIGFLQEQSRATMRCARISSIFWDRIMGATAYVINRTGQSTLKTITPSERYESALDPRREYKPDQSNLRILGSRCFVYIDAQFCVTSEKMEGRRARAVLMGYKGQHNYVVWLIDGGRFLDTPHVVFHENTGMIGSEDPTDIVRSLPPAVQRRLRHCYRKGRTYIRTRDDNVVEEDISPNEDGRPQRGRLKRKIARHFVCEAPPDHSEVLKALRIALSEGEMVSDTDDSAADDLQGSFAQLQRDAFKSKRALFGQRDSHQDFAEALLSAGRAQI